MLSGYGGDGRFYGFPPARECRCGACAGMTVWRLCGNDGAGLAL